jgi:two-component system sensor histidine kinase KdpD
LASATSLLEYDDRLEPEVRRDLLENIQEEVERLNRFVANLLNMTRLESGVLEVRTEPVLVREVVDRVLHRLKRRSGGRRLTQSIACADLEVRADPVLLEQALTNIMENAVSYSPETSEVTIGAEVVGGEVVLDISDEGPGVPRPRPDAHFRQVLPGRSGGVGAAGGGARPFPSPADWWRPCPAGWRPPRADGRAASSRGETAQGDDVMNQPRILVVEDEPQLLRVLRPHPGHRRL